MTLTFDLPLSKETKNIVVNDFEVINAEEEIFEEVESEPTVVRLSLIHI